MFSKQIKLAALVAIVGTSTIVSADTYIAGKHPDVYTLLDSDSYRVPLNSVDRFTKTAQALVIENKISRTQSIKSIRELNPKDLEAPNTRVELFDEVSGKCSVLNARVYNMGVRDENGKQELGTVVEFVGKPSKCK